MLIESEAASHLTDVPYALRHAGVSLRLESGVSPAEVARRAGHSIAVLFRFNAKAIHRNHEGANQQTERALAAAEEW
ncbi:integrase [Streptomyces sp. NRRL S-646]|uniref:integrase n=1 Tax=Streptomyces sp. NRRL S-646 TaxID=1463917 RepID=UPI000AE8BFC2|nr:integrase [Streptomyces sp. NRRL S-646]